MALRLASRRSLSLCEPCKRCSKAPRIVEPLGLAGESPSVLLVIGQDVKHGLPLVGEALVGFVQVARDVEHRAAPLVALPEAACLLRRPIFRKRWAEGFRIAGSIRGKHGGEKEGAWFRFRLARRPTQMPPAG